MPSRAFFDSHRRSRNDPDADLLLRLNALAGIL